MPQTKIYKGNYGFDIVLRCSVDLSGASNVRIAYRKPSGEEGEWSAYVDTIDGETVYVRRSVLAGDLDEAGDWKLQPVLTLAGWTGRGTSVLMRVSEHYE